MGADAGSVISVRVAAIWLPLILAALSMLGPFSVDTPFPAFKAMGLDLSASTDQMQWVVGAYLMSFAVMSPFHGPLSDALGRRPVIIVGIAIYALASIGCALSTSLPMLLAFRVLQGLSAGGGVIVSRTIIRDVFEGATAQRLMSRVLLIFGVAPAVAPIVGGLLLQIGPWEFIFWFLTGFAVLLIAVVVVALPETHPPERRTPIAHGSLMASLAMVSRNARFHRVAWVASLSFAGQFLYIGAAPIFVVDLLGKGELDFWMFFVPMIGGMMIGALISSRTAGVLDPRTLISGSLVFALFGAVVNIVLAAIPATSAQLPYAVIGPALIAVGTGASYPSLQLALLDMFPTARGAAVSMFTFFTLLLNGLGASVLAPWVTGSVLALALASSAFIVAGALLWVRHLSLPRPQPAVDLQAG